MQYDANPIYQIESPMEITALMMTAAAKADGDLSSEEKRGILRMFGEEFHLSKRDAAGLLIASSHLLGKGSEVRDNLSKVLAPSLEKFSATQADSALELIARVASTGSAPSEQQAELIERANSVLGRKIEPGGKWD